jgi:hypothetical protein
MSLYEDESVEFAVFLLPGWRHKTTGKLHIRRDCKAVQYHIGNMSPVLVRLDDKKEVRRALTVGDTCLYCFPGGEWMTTETG